MRRFTLLLLILLAGVGPTFTLGVLTDLEVTGACPEFGLTGFPTGLAVVSIDFLEIVLPGDAALSLVELCLWKAGGASPLGVVTADLEAGVVKGTLMCRSATLVLVVGFTLALWVATKLFSIESDPRLELRRDCSCVEIR